MIGFKEMRLVLVDNIHERFKRACKQDKKPMRVKVEELIYEYIEKKEEEK